METRWTRFDRFRDMPSQNRSVVTGNLFSSFICMSIVFS